MEGFELIAFQIIANTGAARSEYILAIQEAKNGNFEQAKTMMNEGEQLFLEAHRAHYQLIQREMDPEQEEVRINLLLLHAEDQLMAADTFKIIAEEFIDLYKKLEK